jgi:hypothetical protein
MQGATALCRYAAAFSGHATGPSSGLASPAQLCWFQMLAATMVCSAELPEHHPLEHVVTFPTDPKHPPTSSSFSAVAPTPSLAALQILDRNQHLLKALGSGVWPCMVLVSELAQTAILADFW